MKLRHGAVALTMLLSTASVAGQPDGRDAIVRVLAVQDATLQTVGERLSIAARPLCAPGGWAAGVVVQTRLQYGGDYRAVAARVLGVGAYPTVIHVVPGGAADRAGIRAGDQLVAIDADRLPRGDDTGDDGQMADTDRALDALDAGLADGVADLRLLRGDATVTARLHGTPACAARFEVATGDKRQANAARFRIMVSGDLIDPARADQTLAPLVAHELAHVVLRHDRLDDRRGGLMPGFGRNGAAIRAAELAADRLSPYFLALAGYRPADAATFQAEYGRKYGKGILSDRTNNPWRVRVAAIQREVARIAAQQAAGQPIRPPAELMAIPSR